MKWRIKKKKGMLRSPTSREIREQVKKELETEAFLLEQKVCKVELPKIPEAPDIWQKQKK